MTISTLSPDVGPALCFTLAYATVIVLVAVGLVNSVIHERRKDKKD